MRRIVLIVLTISIGSFLLPSFAFSQDDASAKDARRKNKKICRQLLRSAKISFRDGAYNEAKAFLDSLILCDISNPDAYYFLSKINLVRGDTHAAESQASTGIEKAPKSSRLKLLLARIKISLGDYAKALELTESVLKIKPREGKALYYKGLALKGLGDPTAINILEKAVETTFDRKSN